MFLLIYSMETSFNNANNCTRPIKFSPFPNSRKSNSNILLCSLMPKKITSVIKDIIRVFKTPIIAIKRKVQNKKSKKDQVVEMEAAWPNQVQDPKIKIDQFIVKREKIIIKPEVSISQRVTFYEQSSNRPQAIERPARQVTPAIQQLVNKIEVPKAIKWERPLKRVSENIAALAKTIEILKKPKLAVEDEEWALDEFFAWGAVPTLFLDEFFSVENELSEDQEKEVESEMHSTT